jgi:Na+-driven multidrug efflux pump
MKRPDSPTLMAMATPLMVSFVMRAAFTFVDTAYAATIGDAAVAAIGLTFPFEFLMIAAWVGLSNGLTSALSRTMASGEGEKIEQYLRAGWRLVAWVSPVFLAIGIGIGLFAPRFGLEEEVWRNARIYAGVLIGGSALTTFWSVIPDSTVKAHQDTRSTMWAGILSNLLNVTLNTFFLFVLHWGIFGIAFSTVLGRIGGLAYALARARTHERRRRLEGRSPVPGLDPAPVRRILSLAVPAGLTFMLSAAEMGVVNVLLAGMENATESIATFSIYQRVVMFAFNPIIAISVALLPYTGRLIGRNDLEGVRGGVRTGLRTAFLYTLLLVLPVLVLSGPWLARALAESPLTARYTTFALRMAPLTCLVIAPFFLTRPVFEAMGKGRPGLIVASVRVLVLSAPFAWVGMRAAEGLGRPPIYGLIAGLQIVSALTSSFFYLWVRRVLRRPGPGPSSPAPSDVRRPVSEGPAAALSSHLRR